MMKEGEKMRKKKQHIPNVVCTQCGKPFYRKPSMLKAGGKQGFFCCHECSSIYKKTLYRGRGNPGYGLKGKLSPSYKGLFIKRKTGKNTTTTWYYCPDHPYRNKTNRVKYDRFLVELWRHRFDPKAFQKINGMWYLKPELIVHHKDFNTENFAIDNLEIMDKSEFQSVWAKHFHAQKADKIKLTKTETITEGNMKIKFKKLHECAVAPKQSYPGDAGFDLTAISAEMSPNGQAKYHTGIAVEIPDGYVGLVFPRSSIYKTETMLTNSVGVIDSGYRGEICAIFTGANYRIGDRIGQLVIMPIPKIEFEEAEELSPSTRGGGGFGSSGN